MAQNLFAGDFLKNALRELGLHNGSVEAKAELLEQLNDRIATRVEARVHDTLSDEKRGHFDEVLLSGDRGAIERFILANVPDFANIFREEAQKAVDIIKFGGNQ